jgi:hypothetical protein
VLLPLADRASFADNHPLIPLTADQVSYIIVRNTQLLLAARMSVLEIIETLEMTTVLLLICPSLYPRAEDFPHLASTATSTMTISKSPSLITTEMKITVLCLNVSVKRSTLDPARAVVVAEILALLELAQFVANLSLLPAVPPAAAEAPLSRANIPRRARLAFLPSLFPSVP